MDGGGSNCIEKGLWNGWYEVRIKGNMKEKGGKFFLVCSFFVVVIFQTAKLSVVELYCANDLADSSSQKQG